MARNARPPRISTGGTPLCVVMSRVHQSQRGRYALHRATHQRGIADERRIECAGHASNPSEEAHRGPAVAEIERAGRSLSALSNT